MEKRIDWWQRWKEWWWEEYYSYFDCWGSYSALCWREKCEYVANNDVEWVVNSATSNHVMIVLQINEWAVCDEEYREAKSSTIDNDEVEDSKGFEKWEQLPPLKIF